MPFRSCRTCMRTINECYCLLNDEYTRPRRSRNQTTQEHRTLYLTDHRRHRRSGVARLIAGQLEHPYVTSHDRNIARGIYIRGRHAGQKCVIKWRRSSSRGASVSYDLCMARVGRSLVRKWNSTGFLSQPIRINYLALWKLGAGTGRFA
eukprot:IDg2919t1